ncbi:MAG: TIM barrel protein [Chloroflexota bacterium]
MEIKLANAPCSWGVIENIEGERIEYDQVLDELKATGYIGTELGDWGFMPTDPAALTDELKQRELAMLGSWVSVKLHDASEHASSEAECVKTARLLAEVDGKDALIILGNDPYADPHRTKISGRVTPDDMMSDEQWQVFAAGANRVAEAVKRETGLRTVFHHHIGTWVETPMEMQMLMEMTEPELLGMVFDTGHWSFAGGNPILGIEQFANRIWHVHFKDHDPEVAKQSREHEWDGPESVGKGVFCELGKGDVDFAAVLGVLKSINYNGWIVVEQDVLPGMGTPKASAQRNRDYLKTIGL